MTPDVIHSIRLRGPANSDNNVMEEWISFNVDDTRQRSTAYYTDSITKEGDCPNMETIGRSFTSDSNDIKKEDTTDYINDVKEEGTSVGTGNVTKERNTCNIGNRIQGGTSNYFESIKKKRDSPNLDNIGKNFTCNRNDMKETIDYMKLNDIKKEGISKNIDNITENNPCNNSDISEEGISHYLSNSGENFTWNSNDIKKEDIEDIKVESITSGEEQHEHDEAKGAQQTGN